MADRPGQLILDALSRAAAGAAPLHGGRAAPGLFPSTPLGRQAARRCTDEGLLQPQPDSTCSLTEKGRSYLLERRSPRQVLEDFVRALEGREAQLADLLARAGQLQGSLDALRAHLAPVLAACQPGPERRQLMRDFHAAAPRDALLDALARWPADAHRDCPLPELFRQAAAGCPGLSLGAFHDALRALHAEGRAYLHPWTGPLYDMPEPSCALLVGHEVAYYASLRRNGDWGMGNGE